MNRTQRAGLAVWAVILLLCCAGLWVSSGLLALHDGQTARTTSAAQLLSHLCSDNAEGTSGCDAAAHSPWSEVRLPIPWHPTSVPVAFMAMAYFIFLATWYAFVGESALRWRLLKWLPLAVAAAGIYASLFFVSLMALRRAPWCGGCVAVHAINLMLVIAIALSRQCAAAHSRRLVNRRQCVATIAFAVILIGVLFVSRDRTLGLEGQLAQLGPYHQIVESAQADPKLLMDAYLDEPLQAIPLRPDEMAPGKHQLVIFLDYECPACFITETFLRGEVEADFGGTINVVVRHFPLCVQCNPHVSRTVHPFACKAAYAAEAARALGGKQAFARISTLLFADQADLGDVINRDLAVQAGVDADRFMRLMDDASVQKRVREDVDEAHALGVKNTPTLFLDGRQVPQICETPLFWKTIARALATDGAQINTD